ncbi:MAG: universal stress protein [Pseudoxanthomonas sp.]
MTDSRRMPTSLLLATDLGPRCDRALDRCAQLARTFALQPAAATVVEAALRRAQDVSTHDLPDWYRAPEPQASAEKQLDCDLASTGLDWRRYVAEGNAGDFLLRVLAQENAGTDADTANAKPLVVAGPPQPGMLGTATLGSTVDKLLRHTATSLLIVRRRLCGGYCHVLVASDFSVPSMAALQAVHAMFPLARITLLHGFDIPMFGLRDSSRDSAIADIHAQLREQALAFLATAGVPAAQVELVIEHGEPARLAQQYAETFAPDLIALGSHGHGAVHDLVVGSVAKRIIATSALDTLVVRA